MLILALASTFGAFSPLPLDRNFQEGIKLLNNQVVVITGGAGLIGREFVRGVAENGGIAVVADLYMNAATRVAEEIATMFSGRA